jgi:hypothetical protein
MQWLGSLPDKERVAYLMETQDLMIQGVMKPPPPSALTPRCCV